MIIIHPKAKVHKSTEVGVNGSIRNCDKFNGDVIVERGVRIGANCVICKGEIGETRIGEGTIVMNLVNIGHNVTIGKGCEIGAGVTIAGHVQIGDNVKIKVGAVIRNRVKIGDNSIIGMGSVLVSDVDGGTWYGNPAKRIG